LKTMEMLSQHLRNRLLDLEKEREKGIKIVGFMPGGYFPEELALAGGAIPVGMIKGGDHSAVEFSGAYICRWVDTFCRAQIGYSISGGDPYYKILDLLAIPITDNHIRAISDIIDYHTNIDVFTFGIPHMKDPSSFDYYLHGLNRLKTRIESLTGNEITEAKLKEAILLCNQERQLFKELSLMRQSKSPAISGKDFTLLNHGSFLADKRFMIDVLKSLTRELTEQTHPISNNPRILLTGSTLAMGDYRIIDLVEEAGGFIVAEEFAEGIRPYWNQIAPDGDLMKSLADCYFMKRVPPAWFRPGKERLDFIIKLAKDFSVDGVIWYQLMFRESYKTESYYFPDILAKETGLPMLTIESDYDQSEMGQLRTRIETFIETIRR